MTKKHQLEWVEEMFIGSILITPMKRIDVTLCKKDRKEYITVMKNKNSYRNIKGLAINFYSAQQVSSLIIRVFKEDQSLVYNNLDNNDDEFNL